MPVAAGAILEAAVYAADGRAAGVIPVRDVLIGFARIELTRNLPALRHGLQLVAGAHIFEKLIAFVDIAQGENRLKYIVQFFASESGNIGIHARVTFRLRFMRVCYAPLPTIILFAFTLESKKKGAYRNGMPKAENRTGVTAPQCAF